MLLIFILTNSQTIEFYVSYLVMPTEHSCIIFIFPVIELLVYPPYYTFHYMVYF